MKILTYGTFDLFHIGHLRILKRAAEIGTKLYVGLSTDNFNSLKGKQCIYPFEHRKEILESLTCVNFVFPEENWDQKISDIKKYEIDLFVMGDDWRGKFDFLTKFCKVVYLPRTNDISSSEIKEILHNLLKNIKNEEQNDFIKLLIKNL